MKEKFMEYTPWELIETSTDPNIIKHNETLFSLSNGHIGTRGSLEEASFCPAYSYSEGTYCNGLYDTSPINYGEWAYGYAKEHQTIIPLPNGKKLNIILDGEPFNLETGTTIQHKRRLNLKEGVLKRSFIWENSQKNQMEVSIERFVYFDYPEVIAQKIEINPLQSNSELKIIATLDSLEEINRQLTKDELFDPRKKDQTKRSFRTENISTNKIKKLSLVTQASKLRSIVASVSNLSSNNKYLYSSNDLDEEWVISTKRNEKIILERFIGYSSIFKNKNDLSHHFKEIEAILIKVRNLGFNRLKELHLKTMETFWYHSDIEIEGDSDLQIGLRFNIFHLNQAAGRDGKTNISAKGITGEGYEGHYFWDTEMYMLPFFIYTQPLVAKKLLEYRHSILPQARKRAQEMAVPKGALFPWRTINGEEASAYYPAGTAQVHINSDIAHGVYTYIKASGDKKFAYTKGLEILIETARFWAAFGHYDEKRDGLFVINGVTGPDEYTAIVNNNFYTNLMAKYNLKYAIELTKEAIKTNENKTKELLRDISFNKNELKEWEKAASKMFLPYDKEQKLTMQDDNFFHLKVWDLKNTPKEKFPLLLNYHPLTIYRHQVNKQADTVLAQFMFSWAFDLEQKKRDFNYYEKISTHDSSLSRSIYSMMASEINERNKAYSYFMDTALMDLTNMQANTKDGIHAANMGGTWMSLVYGFAGMRLYDGTLHFSPKLPKQWNKLAFKIQYKNSIVQINITQKETKYELIEGLPIMLYQENKAIKVE